MSTKSFPFVLIEWEDSCSEDHWRDIDGKETGPAQCKTAGFLIHETKAFIVVAGSLARQPDHGRPDACSRMTIPKAVIRKRTKLDAPLH